MNIQTTLEIAKKACLEAGKVILDIYNTGNFDIEAKDDNSPLTQADKEGHQIILNHLNQTPYPILSEEGKNIDYEVRKNWDTYWLVDPLDGTKEFIKKNGEFTVNIALIQNHKPILGVVYAPVLDKLYFATKEGDAYLQDNTKIRSIHTEKNTPEITRIVASRSHLNEDTQKFIAQYPKHELLSMGSSLKLMLVAEGKADIYPRLAPTMEWDTAAAQIIVEVAGGKVLNFETKETVFYNKENLLNPYFVVQA